jgi:hypothetical protein
MKNEIDFSTEIKYNVEFNINNKALFGHLNFSNDSGVYLEIITNDMFLSLDNKCEEVINCKCGSDTFKLIGCEKFGSKIYPKFIALNLPSEIDTFSKIELSINELNVILHDGYFSNKFEDERFISEFNKSNFSVDIKSSDNISAISDHWDRWSDIVHTNNIENKITQRHIITIDAKHPLDYSLVIKECRHICLLFTLLTLMQTHINYAWIVHEGNRYPFYFSTIKNSNPKKIEWYNSLLHLKGVDNKTWELIFNKSYANDLFNNQWARFHGMLSYNSYWEYEFLGYMSILDYYLASKCKSRKVKKQTLMQRFIQETSETPCNIINFIALTENHFNRLLHIRNGVAHCDPEKLDVLSDISVLSILNKRLMVYLNYLALRDLGVDDCFYASSALRSFNSVLMNAVTNRKWLNKITNEPRIIKLPRGNFDLLRANEPRQIHTIFINETNNHYLYDESLTKLLSKNMAEAFSGEYNIDEYIVNVLAKDKTEKLESKCINILHVHTDDENDFVEVTSAYLLEKI